MKDIVYTENFVSLCVILCIIIWNPMDYITKDQTLDTMNLFVENYSKPKSRFDLFH